MSVEVAEAADFEFPVDLPEADRVAWSLLTRDRQAKAVLRLQAVLRVVAGEKATAVAKEGVIGRRNLSLLVAEWLAEPGLRALRVHTHDKRTRVTKHDKAQGGAIEAHARAIRREDFSLTNDAVVARLVSQLAGPTPAINAMRRRIDRVRQELKVENGIYGAHIVVDMSCVELANPGDGVYWIALVIDLGTGLVLGWAVGTAEEGFFLARLAGQHASERLPKIRIKGPVSAKVEHFEADLAGARGVAGMREYGRVLAAAAPWTIRYEDGRRLGSHILRTLGKRIDRYYLRPTWMRRPELAETKTIPRLNRAEMDALVAEALEAHNATIINGRRGKVSAVRLGIANAQIASVLKQVFEIR